VIKPEVIQSKMIPEIERRDFIALFYAAIVQNFDSIIYGKVRFYCTVLCGNCTKFLLYHICMAGLIENQHDSIQKNRSKDYRTRNIRTFEEQKLSVIW